MANRSIRDSRTGVPMMGAPGVGGPLLQTPQPTAATGTFAPRPQQLPKPAPVLGQAPMMTGGRPGELPRPPTQVAIQRPPAPMPGATGPGTGSPGMVTGGGNPTNPMERR